MVFAIQSYIESKAEVFLDGLDYGKAQVESWFHEKGYFSQKRVINAINGRLQPGTSKLFSNDIAKSTFSRICEAHGSGIAQDKFIAEFKNVVDTKLSYVRTALLMVRHVLLFSSTFPFEAKDSHGHDHEMDFKGFWRALHFHMNLNDFFYWDAPNLMDDERDGREGGKVTTEPIKTVSDLRRLLFRGIASPLPQHVNVGSGPTKIPALEFIWHEHSLNSDGSQSHKEHRIFQLEDERSIELQEIIAAGRHREVRLSAPNPRQDFRTIVEDLPHYEHHLWQLGIRREEIISFLTLLSQIDPSRPGLRFLDDLLPAVEHQEKWSKQFPEKQEWIGFLEFDTVLRNQVVSPSLPVFRLLSDGLGSMSMSNYLQPHFYLQISKLIGLLAVKRSANGGYGEEDPDEDSMHCGLRTFAAARLLEGHELEDTLVVDASEVKKPLWPCHECWTLGLVREDEDFHLQWA